MSFETLWVVIDQSETPLIPLIPFLKPFGGFGNPTYDPYFPIEPPNRYSHMTTKKVVRLIGIFQTREVAENACAGYPNRQVLGPSFVSHTY
jgi:hypothetical protein